MASAVPQGRAGIRFAACFVLAALIAGCAPEIGDKCQTSVDCSQTGDRLCDTTMPDGYCTIFNCEPDTCPEGDDAVCVEFDAELDPACGSLDDTRDPRFQRSFCMATCEDASDCRAGYVCADPTDPKWRGIIVDLDPVGKKVCIVESPTPATPTTPPPACYPPDASFDVTPYDGGGTGGAGGGGGVGGAGGAGSVGGAGGAGGAGGLGGAGGAQTGVGGFGGLLPVAGVGGFGGL